MLFRFIIVKIKVDLWHQPFKIPDAGLKCVQSVVKQEVINNCVICLKRIYETLWDDKIGPNTEPCGTPYFSGVQEEEPFTTTENNQKSSFLMLSQFLSDQL